MRTRRKLLEREYTHGEQGLNRPKKVENLRTLMSTHSKESREFENRAQTARKGLENLEDLRTGANTARKRVESLKTGRKLLERDQGISEHGASCSKEIREFQNKEQTARKRLENLRTRRKLLETD